MYWRVKKIGPQQIARQYGVHAALIVSVLFNLVFLTKMNPSKAFTGEQKTDFSRFAKQVTNHLFDANYLTVEDSMNALTKEIAGPVLRQQKQNGFVPASNEDLKAIAREMREKQSVSCVKFDRVEVGQPNEKSFVPVDVRMQVIIHNTEGVLGPKYFALKYLCANARRGEVVEPIIVAFQPQEASGPPSDSNITPGQSP